MYRIIRLTLVICSLFTVQWSSAQRVALSTNTIDWLMISPNLSLETRLSQRLTLNIGVAANPFNRTPYGSDIKLKNFRINPELRYWFNRPMAKHFVGLALTGGAYNLQLKKHLYECDIAAAGITYGYALVLGRHWNVEFSLGVGLGRVWGYDYTTSEEKPASRNMNRWIPVPIRTGVSFSYIFD